MNPEEREALVRTSTDAWNSNDFETLKAIWSPEGVIVSPEGWPEVGTFSGWDARSRSGVASRNPGRRSV